MFNSIVSIIVVPTLRYQGTLKSTNLPDKIGKLFGIFISGTLAFTNSISSTAFMNSNINIFGTELPFSSVLFLNL